MSMKSNGTQVPLYIAVGFLLAGISLELISILILNNGLLVYTLDDAYIHMALAENILDGHYGINSNEFSAPSSSIIWPFIIAPFSRFEYFPLLLNLASAVATVLVFVRILQSSFRVDDARMKSYLVTVGAISLILATNCIGLPISGMEHSLQLLLAVTIVYGLIIEIEQERVTWWLFSAIIIAPLIRYECMAISVSAITYLVMRHYIKESFLTATAIIIPICGFSIFLVSLGLDPFPSSIVAKSSIVESGGKLKPLMLNLRESLIYQRTGVLMSVGALALMLYFFFSDDKKRKCLALIAIFAVSMHFVAGHYGWLNRYEIYIWSFMLLVTLYIFGPKIAKTLAESGASDQLRRAIIGLAIPITFSGIQYIWGLFVLPIASNNIYEQQYQMHRFAVDYYQKSVAVNDLGYVSYKNPSLVLDLYGLGSIKALRYRKDGNLGNWMGEMTKEANIGLVMIYPDLFDRIPDEWIRLGSLHLGKMRVTAYASDVVFYATSRATVAEAVEKLKLFTETLPRDVKFTYQ